jgi:GxxExxY protein
MKHEELTGKVIACAYRVYNEMGFGFLESVYRNCMVIELRALGLQADPEAPIAVFYKGQPVGQFFTDIRVEGVVLVELKSVRALVVAHEVQLVNYLKATGIEIGLLINFGESKVEVKRKVRSLELLRDQ